MAALGHDVRVFTSSLKSHRSGETLCAAFSCDWDHGVPVSRFVPEHPLTRSVCLPGLKQALSEFEPDILHAHDIWRGPTRVAMDVARDLGTPLLLNPVFHDRSHEPQADRWNRELRDIVSALPPTTLVLFNTEWERECLDAAGHTFSRVGYLPPAVDLQEIDGTPDRPPASIPADRFVLLSVGRFAPEKGLDLLLQSFGEVLAHRSASDREDRPLPHLVLAGFRDAAVDYESVARLHGVATHTTFLYDLPRDQIINLMRRADLFVLPSRAETFGIVVIEAWATGNLVLASQHAALPYVIQHGENGLLTTDEDLTHQLIQAIANRRTPAMEALVAAGRWTVELKYTRDRQMKTLQTILRRK